MKRIRVTVVSFLGKGLKTLSHRLKGTPDLLPIAGLGTDCSLSPVHFFTQLHSQRPTLLLPFTQEVSHSILIPDPTQALYPALLFPLSIAFVTFYLTYYLFSTLTSSR